MTKEKRKKGKFGSPYTLNRSAQTFCRLTTSVSIFKGRRKEGKLFNKPNLSSFLPELKDISLR